MSKSTSVSVAELLQSSVITGLDWTRDESGGWAHPDTKAWMDYFSTQLGVVRALSKDDEIKSFSLKGKVTPKKDNRGGKLTLPTIEFTGSHNAATLVLHFASLMYSQADKLGICTLQVDVTPIIREWLDHRERLARIKAENAKREKQGEEPVKTPVGFGESVTS